jgi:N-acetylmuramoyl-L-alanine amidase CwlA
MLQPAHARFYGFAAMTLREHHKEAVMQIHKYHGSYNIQRRTQPVKYIVVHYTGSGTPAAGSALANCKYFSGGDRQASAHYFIDDSGVWEYADPAEYFTWHCGDGHGRYGISNSNSIGIEVCQNGDRPYTPAEKIYLRELVQSLMKKFGVPASRVVRHYDASRKMCPFYYAKRPAEWEKLKAEITGQSAPQKPSESKPAPSAPTKTLLAVDGSWGIATTTKAQKVFGTTADGIVSNQPTANRKYLPNCYSGSWQFKSSGYGAGSQLVRAIQRKTGATVDGWFGRQSVQCLQKWLGVSVDGYCGPATVRAFQRWLNTR